jgi:hypothetical protein
MHKRTWREDSMKKLLCGAVLALGLIASGAMSASLLAPKSIEDIMDAAHDEKDSLRDKVVKGKGSAEDAKKLLALYEDLGKNDPPKGDKAAWKKKTDAIVLAAKKVAANHEDKEALAALTKATNCAACHKEHRP